MERRRGEVIRDDVPPSMADHDDVGRRVVVRPRRRDGRPAPARPGRGRAGDARPTRRLRRAPGHRLAARAGSSSTPTTARRRWTPSPSACWPIAAGTDAGVVRAQRPQARQLPVRPGRPRPRAVDLRLGHDDAGRAADRPRHAAQLLARPDATRRTPAGSATRACSSWACRRAREITARYAERTGIDTSSATWYEAFAQWKTGVVIQQLHRRWERGESTDPRMATIADRLPLLAAHRRRACSTSSGRRVTR